MDLDAALIREVRSQPVLYDPNDPMYKDIDHKQRIWSNIGRKIMDTKDGSTTVTALKVRWKNLRDAYVKERKRDLAQTYGFNVKLKRPWRLKQQLEFLAPFVQNRKEFSDCITGYENSIPKKSERKRKKTTANSQHSKDIFDVVYPAPPLTNLFNEPIPMSNDHGFIEIDSFFRGIADAVKGLNRNSQMIVEKEITKLIMNCQLRELAEGSNMNG